jgi:CRP-like cAMP-binding protein
MKTFKAFFEIAEEINCPLYNKGEQMVLTDKTFSCPAEKEVCLILVRDMTQLLFTLISEKGGGGKALPARIFSCSGCTGLIKFRQIEAQGVTTGDNAEKIEARIDSAMQEIHGRVITSPFLQSIPSEKVTPVLRKFQEVAVPAKTILIHQGEPNPNLYLIMTGSFAVENNGERIAVLTGGEIFGEMSYLGTGEAVATVRALDDSLVLAVTADDFSHLLNSATSVQVFMAKLLADRLQQINAARARDFESCMSGKIDDVVPAELFQVFHMHQKTGVLVMSLAQGEARVSFREGCIINASYCDKRNEHAIFDMLAEKKGYYRFNTGLTAKEMKAAEIGDFMALLMEGVKRVDEES